MQEHGISIESIIKMLEEPTAPMILLEYEEDIETKHKHTEEINTQITLSLE